MKIIIIIMIIIIMCVCYLVIVLLLVEPIAGKNSSPSDKQLWRFLKNFLVAEKSQCKALLISHHLEISLLLLMSGEKHQNANFCISFGWAFSIIITSCSSATYGVLFINS